LNYVCMYGCVDVCKCVGIMYTMYVRYVITYAVGVMLNWHLTW